VCEQRLERLYLLQLAEKMLIELNLFSLSQVLTTQALVGTVIAIAGTWLYTDVSSKAKHAKKPEPPAEPKAA
jgi:hypothetical protein